MAVNMMPPGLPPMHVQQAGQQLGMFMKVYKANLLRILLSVIACVIAALFSIGFTIQDVGNWSHMLLGLMATLCFLWLAVYVAYTGIQVATQQIYLYQGGLLIENKGQVQVFPWQQAAEVWQDIVRHYRNGIYTGTTYKYRLRRTDGYQIRLDNKTKDIAELGMAVTQGITRELIPRALYSIRAGQTLTFAQFSINQQGIGNGQAFIPWPQVEAVTVNRGRVSVKKAGQFFNWGTTRVARIPNFFVFTGAAEEMIRQTRGGR